MINGKRISNSKEKKMSLRSSLQILALGLALTSFHSSVSAQIEESMPGTLKVYRAFSVHGSGPLAPRGKSSIHFSVGTHRISTDSYSTGPDGERLWIEPFDSSAPSRRVTSRVFNTITKRDWGNETNSVYMRASLQGDVVPWGVSGQTFDLQSSTREVKSRGPNRVIKGECQVKVSTTYGEWNSGSTYAFGTRDYLVYDDVTVMHETLRFTDRASRQLIALFEGKKEYRNQNTVRELGPCKLHQSR